jgi:uncharacterized Zn-binding protein involved in type VI secretion
MPAVTRIGDLSTGHDGAPPRPAANGSPDVFCNGIPVVRVQDLWQPHHDSPEFVDIGSPTVYVNGLPVSRIGDHLNCDDYVAEGSPNVFSG